MAAHARLSPSSADRWMVCRRSVRLIEQLVAQGLINPDASTGAADEGTAAHHFRELALTMGMEIWAFEGLTHTVNGVPYPCDSAMVRHLQKGQDWILEQPGEMIVEYKVNLQKWIPGGFGRMDTAIIDRQGRRLVLLDLKYGAGIDVPVEQNRQQCIYAIGVLDNFDLWEAIDEVLIVIDQPRCGGFKTWPTTVDYLAEFAQEVRAAALDVDNPDAALVYSQKGCTFCPVKDTEQGCSAYTQHLVDMLGDDLFDDLETEPTLVDPYQITPERRWYLVKHSSLITKWLAKLHGDSLQAALAGEPDPGSKAVKGKRGARYYTDQAAAEQILVEALGDDAWDRSLKTATKAVDLLEPKRNKPGNPVALSKLNDIIKQDDGRPILVPESDAKPALTPLADAIDELDDFD